MLISYQTLLSLILRLHAFGALLQVVAVHEPQVGQSSMLLCWLAYNKAWTDFLRILSHAFDSDHCHHLTIFFAQHFQVGSIACFWRGMA
jgi:hypothetical protein